MSVGCFRYHSGETVRLGDRVFFEGRHYGVVQAISLPDTEEAEAECDPEGSVMVAENVGGIMGMCLCHPTQGENVGWRTTVFLHRGEAATLPRGSGAMPWPYEPGPSDLRNAGKQNEEQG
jgi:hypothetical protein